MTSPKTLPPPVSLFFPTHIYANPTPLPHRRRQPFFSALLSPLASPLLSLLSSLLFSLLSSLTPHRRRTDVVALSPEIQSILIRWWYSQPFRWCSCYISRPRSDPSFICARFKNSDNRIHEINHKVIFSLINYCFFFTTGDSSSFIPSGFWVKSLMQNLNMVEFLDMSQSSFFLIFFFLYLGGSRIYVFFMF